MKNFHLHLNAQQKTFLANRALDSTFMAAAIAELDEIRFFAALERATSRARIERFLQEMRGQEQEPEGAINFLLIPKSEETGWDLFHQHLFAGDERRAAFYLRHLHHLSSSRGDLTCAIRDYERFFKKQFRLKPRG